MRLQDGLMPIRRALENGSDNIVEMLIKAGADVSGTSEVRSFSQRACALHCNL
jgi:ankyrin repeat protein